MIKILKRDGSIMDFDIKKIENAIERAFMQEHKFYTHDLIEMLALRVTADFNSKIKADETVSVEDIQDSVEVVLIQASYEEVAKAYILYRKHHENIRKTEKSLLNYKYTVDS